MSDDILEDLQAQLDEANDLIQDLEGRLNQAEEERDEAVEGEEDLQSQVYDLESDLADEKGGWDKAEEIADGVKSIVSESDIDDIVRIAFGSALAKSNNSLYGAQVNENLSRNELENMLIDLCQAVRALQRLEDNL